MKLINESSSEVNLGTQVPVPSTLTSTGFVGQWAVDSSFLYVCTATNTWKKTAISTSGSGSSSAINWVSVKDFGATGDGVTDDTTAINAAIASIPASGGTVYVPEGTYMITAGNPYSGSSTDGSIRLKSNVHFKMAKNAIIKVITNSLQNYAVFNLKAASTFIDNVTIEGGMLIGDRTTHTGDVTETSQQGMGIWLEGASNVRIINVTTQNMWGDGIYTKFHSTLGNNKNVLISGFKSYNDRRQGISLCAIDGVTITNSIIENTNGISGASSGIDIEPELGGTVTNVTITGNIFRNCRNGMSVQGATWGVISGNVFTGNTQYGLRLAEPAQYFSVTGNVAKGNALDGFYLNYAVDNIISDNVSQGNGANGINLSNHCDRTTVSNNRCIGNTIAGISSTNGNNLIISGNHCNSNGDSGFDIETGKYNQIDNNQAFGNTKHGIIIYLSSFNKVEGNISSQNGQHGIRIVSCTDTHISNNEATENSQSTTLSYDNICLEGTTTNCFVIGNMARKGALAKLPRNGLRIDSSTVTGTTVSENDLRGGGQTLDYNDLGTGTIIPTKTGTATPTVNANYVGQQFIDTTNKKIYISTGAGAGSADWVDTTATGGIQVVSSLPTATSTLRGTTAILQGGTGVPDTMYVCMKLGDDTYDWFAVR
jgi:parallel beta-helix repeat protein